MAVSAAQVTELSEVRGDAGKRRKFVEIAERRTANAIKAIRVLGNLANKAHYQYDDRDVKKIVGALSEEVDTLKQKLLSSERQKKVEFKL